MLELVELLWCKIGGLPMTYRSHLGMPLVAYLKVKLVWNPILEKMEHRVSGWKKLYLSKGGRLALLNGVHVRVYLHIIYLCSLSLLVWWIGLRSSIEIFSGRVWKFLWGGMGDEFKHHLVGWDMVLTPIANGGLGFRKLVTFNQALLGKWFMLFLVGGNVAMQICSSCEIWRGVGRLVH